MNGCPEHLNKYEEKANSIKMYDMIQLKDGRSAQVVDLLDGKAFLVDVKEDDEYDTILVKRDQILDNKL